MTEHIAQLDNIAYVQHLHRRLLDKISDIITQPVDSVPLYDGKQSMVAAIGAIAETELKIAKQFPRQEAAMESDALEEVDLSIVHEFARKHPKAEQ